ncbi:hypothetical protein [Pseudoruegeria sp. HB172150]|uniref:hypothetical protein n=1 Tax=Pseudoruegeria sp. HB172150 TaxID=2721164 RepID=UPI001C130CAA|nr:hypothetical protein [Pseudoruegeria sp. HB172150]
MLALAAPADAQDNALPPFTVKPIRIEVLDKNDFGTNIENDEIVVFAVAALASEIVVDAGDFIPGAGEVPTGLTAPGVRVKAYGNGTGEENDFLKLSDLEHLSLTTGESASIAGLPVWGFGGEPQGVANPAELGFLFFVVERDDGFPFSSISGAVTGVVTGELVQSGIPLEERFNRARQRVGEALDSLVSGFPSDDDVIGPVQAMVVSGADFSADGPLVRELDFISDEKSAHYVVRVRIVREATLRMGDGGAPQSGSFEFDVHDPDSRSRCAGNSQVCVVEVWADGVIAGSIPVQNGHGEGQLPVGPFGAQSIVATLRDGNKIIAQTRASFPIQQGPITGGISEPEGDTHVLAGVGTDFSALFTRNLAPLPCETMTWRREQVEGSGFVLLDPNLGRATRPLQIDTNPRVRVTTGDGQAGSGIGRVGIGTAGSTSATATLGLGQQTLQQINPQGCQATFRFDAPGFYRVVVSVTSDGETVEAGTLVSVAAAADGAALPDLTAPRSGTAANLGSSIPVSGMIFASDIPAVVRLEMRLQNRPGAGWTEVPVTVSPAGSGRFAVTGAINTIALNLASGSYDLRLVTGTSDGVSARETTRLILVEPPK